MYVSGQTLINRTLVLYVFRGIIKRRLPSSNVYEVRPGKDRRGVDLISDVLPFGRLWYTKPDDAVDYAKFFSRAQNAVIRVYDNVGKVIETHEHAGNFVEP